MATLRAFCKRGGVLALLLATGCGVHSSSDAPGVPPAGNAASPVVSATAGGARLELENHDSTCSLRYEGALGTGTFSLAISPPARFILDQAGTPMAWTFEAPRTTTILIVLGGRVAPDELTPVTRRQDCGNAWQGVLIGPEGIRVSKRVARGLACAGMGLDRKEFRLFLADDL